MRATRAVRRFRLVSGSVVWISVFVGVLAGAGVALAATFAVNSTLDVAALDVFINFSRQVTALPMNAVSPGVELDADPIAGTSYEFDFNISGSSQASLQLPGVVLLGGQLYTIYVVGSASALAVVVVQDN